MFEVKHLGYEAGRLYFFDAKKMLCSGRSSTWTGEDQFSSQLFKNSFFTKVSGVPGPYKGTGSTGNGFFVFVNKNCHTSVHRRVLAVNEDDIR